MSYTVHPAPDRPWACCLTRIEQAERVARNIAEQSPGSIVEIRWRGGLVATVRTDAAGRVWLDEGASAGRLL